MHRSVVLLSLALSACTGEPSLARTSPPLTNADATTAHPAIVALRTRREICPEGHQVDTFCTGVVVGPRAVVTAAHCLAGRDPAEIEVFFGDDAFAPGRLARVISAVKHPAFDPVARSNDLAVLSIVGGPTVGPIERADASSLAKGTDVLLVGFGQPASGGEGGLKREGIARITAVDPLTLSLEPGPSLACGGDSGGAVLVGGKLVAVIRSGDETCRAYAIATRVDAYEAAFLQAAITKSESTEPTAIGDPMADRCAEICERDEQCPAGMFCLPDRDGSRCGYRGLRTGRFAGACTSKADCNGFGCGSYGAGDEQSCRCFVPCSALAPPPVSAPTDGCTMGSASRGEPFLLLFLALAGVMRVRHRSGTER